MATEILLGPESAAVSTQQSAGSAFSEAWKLSNIGEYEAARQALKGFWDRIGERPRTEGLAPVDQAELLLRAGALSGWLGSTGQVAGAQQFAKDLISEGLRSFEALGFTEKVAEAQTDLAVCYWREGAMDEARVWFQSALALSTDPTVLVAPGQHPAFAKFRPEVTAHLRALIQKLTPWRSFPRLRNSA